MSDLPERIWADRERKGKWVEVTWTDIYPGGDAAEYVRADLLAAKDAEITRLTHEVAERDCTIVHQAYSLARSRGGIDALNREVAAAEAAALERAAKGVDCNNCITRGLCSGSYNCRSQWAEDIRAIPRDVSALDAVVAERTADAVAILKDMLAFYEPHEAAIGSTCRMGDLARAALAKIGAHHD